MCNAFIGCNIHVSTDREFASFGRLAPHSISLSLLFSPPYVCGSLSAANYYRLLTTALCLLNTIFADYSFWPAAISKTSPREDFPRSSLSSSPRFFGRFFRRSRSRSRRLSLSLGRGCVCLSLTSFWSAFASLRMPMCDYGWSRANVAYALAPAFK